MNKLVVVKNIFQNDKKEYIASIHIGIDDGSEDFDDTRSVYHENFKIPYLFNDEKSRETFMIFVEQFCLFRFEKEIVL